MGVSRNRAGSVREYEKFAKNSVYLYAANNYGLAKYTPISHNFPSFSSSSTWDGIFTLILETEGFVAGYV
jgi:hypothetical protein